MHEYLLLHSILLVMHSPSVLADQVDPTEETKRRISGERLQQVIKSGAEHWCSTLITASFTELTISPCCPGIPDVPGKPLSPYEEETETHSFIWDKD